MLTENLRTMSSDFGETVFAPDYPKRIEEMPNLDIVNNAGWHKVNKLYNFDMPNGFGDYQLIFTVSGNGMGHIDDRHFRLEKNTVFIIPPHIPTRYHTADSGMWELYWLHLDGENAEKILSGFTEKGIYLLDISDANIIKRIKQIMTPGKSPAEKYFHGAKTISQILFEMIYIQSRDLMSDTDIADELLSYLEQEEIQINLKEFASSHFISQTHLIRLFSKKYGETPYSYHRSYKMNKAAQRLIYTDLQIKAIASMAGYESESAFSTQFFKIYKISPLNYRKQHRVYQN